MFCALTTITDAAAADAGGGYGMVPGGVQDLLRRVRGK